jgi:protein-S-isoprenylcysteine O-methyltransferase Ste14
VETTDTRLGWRSTRSALRALLGQSLVLFAAAWSFDYWQAWLYLGFTLCSTLGTNLWLLRYDRELMRRRLAMEEVGESEPVQRRFVVLVVVLGVSMFAVCGLDHRFGWCTPALGLQLLGFALLGLALALVFVTFRANTFGSSIVTVEMGQRVVSSGPYRLVRHPMYSGMLLGGLATPLCLGSGMGELLFVPLCAIFIVRLRAEEHFLRTALEGYAAYLERTPKSLIPGIW